MTQTEHNELIFNLLEQGYSAKKLAKAIEQGKKDWAQECSERDAEYEMGRGACPPGYFKRKSK